MGITVVGTVNAIEAELQNELPKSHLPTFKGKSNFVKKNCAQTKIIINDYSSYYLKCEELCGS